VHPTKNNTAIVIAITENWVFAAATLMLSMKGKFERPFDLIIFHYGVKEREQALLNQIMPCRFIEFDWPVPDTIRCSRGTQMNFSRFVCFEFLDCYDKVIWMDADIMVLKNMDGLFDYGDSGMAMVPYHRTFDSIYKNQVRRWKFDLRFSKYRFGGPLLSGGVMIFSNTLDSPFTMGDWCFLKMWEWSGYNTSTQPIIHIMVQEFDISVEFMDTKFNSPLYLQTDETIFLHPWGKRKFWNEVSNPLWDHYYSQWLKLSEDSSRKLR